MRNREFPPDVGRETQQMLVMVGWIGLIHFFVEALIMGMLSGWQLSRTVVMEGLLDCVLLTVFSSPLIYVLVAKPFIVSARNAESLYRANCRCKKSRRQSLPKSAAAHSSLRP